MYFEVDRASHTNWQWNEASPELKDGDVALDLGAFAFTANNITYAVAGDMLDYWGFFPAEAPWGRIPVMGYGRVVESRNADVAVGGRYFGFYPMTDRHVVNAEVSSSGFRDIAPYRANHAAVYRSFELQPDESSADLDTDYRTLLVRGLFITSWLIDDFLVDNNMFGANQVLITSASSKTSIALAHSLRRSGRATAIGLTSERNRAFVEGLDLYDAVVLYDDLDALDHRAPSVIVDMAGNTTLKADLHSRLADLRYSCAVGATHRDNLADTGEIAAPAPEFFFAPTQIEKRSQEWGAEVLNKRMGAALAEFVADAERWMTVEVSTGRDAVAALYLSTLAGEVSPATGQIGVLNAPQ